MVRYEGSAIHPWDECFVVVRHPYERVVSALTMAGADLTTDAFMARVSSDMHLSTYQSWINGRDAMPVRLEALAKKPGFPHLHRRDHPEWFDTSIDWGRVYPFYKEDFELCPDWSYQIAA